jgi:hypothetical protein
MKKVLTGIEIPRLKLTRSGTTVAFHHLKGTKKSTLYMCIICGQQKSVETGHSQLKGKWFCPNDLSQKLSFEEWCKANK